MKVNVIRVGRLSQQSLSTVASEYKKRINAFVKTQDVEIRCDQNRDKRSAARSLKPIYEPSSGEYLVLLDERGQRFNSLEFSEKLREWMDDPRIKQLSFLVGSPYGFDDATHDVANAKWSLSPLTLPSDFAWLLTWEQIYRGFTILKGMPYHHD